MTSRSLRALLAAALAAAPLAACSADRDPAAAPSPDGSASPSVSGSPSATASATATTTPSTAASSAATATTAPGSAPPASPSPVGSTAPGTRMTALGRYVYTQDGSESYGPRGGARQTRAYPGSLTVTVRRGLTADSRVLDVPYSPDRRDTHTLRYVGSRIEIVRSDAYVRVGSYEQRRSLVPTPPILAYPAGAEVGMRRTGRFTGPEGDGSWILDVVRRERLRVGGRPVDTVVVSLQIRLETGEVTGSVRGTTYWDPARALPIRQRTDSELRDTLSDYTSSVTTMLTRLP